MSRLAGSPYSGSSGSPRAHTLQTSTSWYSELEVAATPIVRILMRAFCLTFNRTPGIVSRFCSEWDAVEAFSFLTWILLMTYTITLAFFAFTGRRSWTGSVRDAPAAAPVHEKSQPVPMTATSTASPAPASSYPNTANTVPMSVQRAEV